MTTKTKLPWTKAEFARFDRLTMKASSPHQLTRIMGRLALQKFVEKHGKEKCDAMFAELKKQDEP